MLEVGASAGLNLRWDHFAYDTGRVVAGDPDSPVRFERSVGGRAAGAAGDASRSPSGSGATATRSMPPRPRAAAPSCPTCGPTRPDRFARLEAAIEVARRVPAVVEQADAPDWVAARLAEPAPGLATVVVHSIVLQYLSHAGAGAVPGRDRLGRSPGDRRERRWPGCGWSRAATERRSA